MIVRPARPAQASIALCLFVLVLAALGCTEKLVEPPPAPQTVLATPDSIQQIFTQSCALSNCHAGSNPTGGQNLAGATTSYANIVDVASTEILTLKRIAPGDSANSYMVMKLRDAPGIQGGRMPLNRPALDPALILRIATWAQQGAPGEEVPAAGTVATR